MSAVEYSIDLTVRIIADDWTCVGAPVATSHLLTEEHPDWWVVAAPRPLDAGDSGAPAYLLGKTWQKWDGDMIVGRFFAAGDPTWLTPMYANQGHYWRCMDARRFALVTLDEAKAHIVERLRAEFAGSPLDYLGDGLTWAQMARDVDTWILDPNGLLLPTTQEP
jgi:hypothetical protein